MSYTTYACHQIQEEHKTGTMNIDYLEWLLQNKWANDIGIEVMLRHCFVKCYITPEFQTACYGPNTPLNMHHLTRCGDLEQNGA